MVVIFMSTAAGVNRINDRDRLPGISKRFDPQETITIYKEIVESENEFFKCQRNRVCVSI